MTTSAKKSPTPPRIRSLGDHDLATEVSTSSELFEELESSSLLRAPPERAEMRMYRDGLSGMSAQVEGAPERSSGRPKG